jgi:hypothetical protein
MKEKIMNEILTLLAVGLIGAVLFIFLRGFVLWYFRISELVSVLKEIRDRLPAPRIQATVDSSDPAPGAFEKWAARFLRA